MNKRGAYFFVLDAIIGGAILLVTLVTIMNSNFNAPNTKSTYTLAEDTLNFMHNTKVINYRSEYVNSLLDQGIINDPELTIFEQTATFYYNNNFSLARNFTKKILDSVLENQYGVSYSIDNTTIYNRSLSNINISNFVLTSRKIVFVTENATTQFGPDIVEMRVWK